MRVPTSVGARIFDEGLKMKKKIGLLSLLIFLLLLLSACGKYIGQIRGPERENIFIDGTEYRRMDDTMGFSVKDKGSYLGKVTDAEGTVFRVYALNSDPERQYLYCRWEWEGYFFKRCS